MAVFFSWSDAVEDLESSDADNSDLEFRFLNIAHHAPEHHEHMRNEYRRLLPSAVALVKQRCQQLVAGPSVGEHREADPIIHFRLPPSSGASLVLLALTCASSTFYALTQPLIHKILDQTYHRNNCPCIYCLHGPQRLPPPMLCCCQTCSDLRRGWTLRSTAYSEENHGNRMSVEDMAIFVMDVPHRGIRGPLFLPLTLEHFECLENSRGEYPLREDEVRGFGWIGRRPKQVRELADEIMDLFMGHLPALFSEYGVQLDVTVGSGQHPDSTS